MQLKEDSDLYDTFHEGFLRGLFGSIKEELEHPQSFSEVTIPDEYFAGIVETIAFNVAATIDGSAVMEFEGKDVVPFLAFEDNGKIITNDVGCYLHEMVMGYLDEHDLEDF